MTFNGHQIGDRFLQFAPDRGILSEVENTMQTVGTSNGDRFMRGRIKSRVLPVQYDVMAISQREFERMMAPLLYTNEPAKLSFSDRTDEYWLAKVDGKIDLTRAYFLGSGTINFIVPDGVAHSLTTKTANNMPYKDVSVNLLKGTSDKPQTATGGDFLISTIGTFNSIKGLQYTVSVDLEQMDHMVVLQAWTMSESNRVKMILTSTLETAGRHSVTFTAPTSDDYDNISVQLAWTNDSDAGSYAWSKGKVEAGNTASPWSPNPADPEYSEYYSDTITVHNYGTAPTAPILTATMNGDNGLVAWTNDAGGVLQFGANDEIDGTQHDDSETVFHHTMMAAPTGITLNAGTVVYKNYLGDTARPNKQAGSFQYAKDTATPMYNRTASDNWAGPSMSGTIAANSQGSNTGNLLWANRINLATNAKASGRIEFNLTSGDTVALSMVLHDSYYTADVLALDLIAMGKTIWTQNLNRKLFTNGFYSLQIGKLGNQATFRLAKIQTLEGGMKTGQTLVQSPTIVGLADASIDGYTVWMTGFSDKTGWTINWSDSIFQWVNVDYWQDLPNRFSAGDELVVDVATKTVYVNGVEDGTVQAIGNDWDKFMIQPGENTLHPVASSWADPFTAKIEYREAWL
ncbi:distal tail protein Dit [Lacticaseibacillus salsurivasis]|uniref:distal tail protein Dit n=1 Tax=Lacticaseibacillus salsurivasis TaxID=3081441 RepID=UPI0030C700F1